MSANISSSEPASPSAPAPRRRPRWIRNGLLVVFGCVALVLLLFVVNGVWLASNETPLLGGVIVMDGEAWGGPRIADEEGAAHPGQVKILSYNIAKGFVQKGSYRFDSVENVQRRMNEITDLMRRERPDLVFLSETVFECGPCPVNQVKTLAATGRGWYWAFGENYNFGLPFYRIVGGNAILSRWPLTPLGNPSLAGRQPFYVTKNNRRALWCEVQIGGRGVLLCAVHNDSFKPKNNLAQAQQLLDYAPTREAILAGDFNARPNEPSIRLIAASGRFTPVVERPLTFPTGKPDQRIDFIFAPAGWRVIEQHVPECAASDHLPVVATFEFSKR